MVIIRYFTSSLSVGTDYQAQYFIFIYSFVFYCLTLILIFFKGLTVSIRTPVFTVVLSFQKKSYLRMRFLSIMYGMFVRVCRCACVWKIRLQIAFFTSSYSRLSKFMKRRTVAKKYCLPYLIPFCVQVFNARPTCISALSLYSPTPTHIIFTSLHS